MSGVKRKNGTRHMKVAAEKASNRKLNMVVRKVAIDLFGAIVRATPVDTGRARGSWGVGINRPKPGPHDKKDKTGSEVDTEVLLALRGYKPGDKITLSSNLPHIGALEKGHSQQAAPNAMVKRNVLRFAPMLRSAAKEARRRA